MSLSAETVHVVSKCYLLDRYDFADGNTTLMTFVKMQFEDHNHPSLRRHIHIVPRQYC
jgi:hypothetical protein